MPKNDDFIEQFKSPAGVPDGSNLMLTAYKERLAQIDAGTTLIKAEYGDFNFDGQLTVKGVHYQFTPSAEKQLIQLLGLSNHSYQSMSEMGGLSVQITETQTSQDIFLSVLRQQLKSLWHEQQISYLFFLAFDGVIWYVATFPVALSLQSVFHRWWGRLGDELFAFETGFIRDYCEMTLVGVVLPPLTDALPEELFRDAGVTPPKYTEAWGLGLLAHFSPFGKGELFESLILYNQGVIAMINNEGNAKVDVSPINLLELDDFLDTFANAPREEIGSLLWTTLFRNLDRPVKDFPMWTSLANKLLPAMGGKKVVLQRQKDLLVLVERTQSRGAKAKKYYILNGDRTIGEYLQAIPGFSIMLTDKDLIKLAGIAGTLLDLPLLAETTQEL